MKSYIWMGAIILVLIAAMFFAVRITAGPKITFDPNVINPTDYVEGNASSSVIIVEYSDFQCPACRTYYFMMRELMVEFGDRVALVYHHFPLTEIHQNAEPAARAAEAAGKQGKFWEMHNLLFEKQDEWAKTDDAGTMFESYATLLGISVEQFRTDFSSQEIKDHVKAERASALKLGLPGTPSFFVNGKQIQNPSTTDAFKEVINSALKK
jgi:protein-disulfide isomerase